MAYEQNPYNLKLSFVADPGLTAITNQYFSQPMTVNTFVKMGATPLGGVGSTITPSAVSGAGTAASPFACTVSSTTGMVVGMIVTGTGIAGTVVLGLTATNVNVVVTSGTITNATPLTFTQANSGGNTPSVTALAANTDRPVGVLQNAPRTRFSLVTPYLIEGQDEAEVTIAGIVKCVAGGTIALGDPIGVTSAGLAQTLAIPSSTRYLVGTALSAGVSGDVITIAVDCTAAGRAA